VNGRAFAILASLGFDPASAQHAGHVTRDNRPEKFFSLCRTLSANRGRLVGEDARNFS
jgi:hypothetical protein